MKQKLNLTIVLMFLASFLFAQQKKEKNTITKTADSLIKPVVTSTVQARDWEEPIGNGGTGTTPVKPGTLNPGIPTTPPVAVPTTNGKAVQQTVNDTTGLNSKSAKGAALSAEKINPPKCSPWRSIVGYYLLCKELNSVRNCAVAICQGDYITQTKTKLQLSNSSGSTITYMGNQVITIAEQNNLITIANNWAATNTPAGYTIRYIKFLPDVAVPNGVSVAGIDIEVTYNKCTGPKKIYN